MFIVIVVSVSIPMCKTLMNIRVHHLLCDGGSKKGGGGGVMTLGHGLIGWGKKSLFTWCQKSIFFTLIVTKTPNEVLPFLSNN